MQFTGTHYTATYTPSAAFDFENFLFEASGWVGDTEEGIDYLGENDVPAFFVYASGDVRPAPKANKASIEAFIRRTFKVSENWTVTGYKDKPVIAAASVEKIASAAA